jgi:uncharacterized protein YndB with AHSA1/START domain
MAQHRVMASRLVAAPPQKVYALLADYQVGHPSILPKPYFVSLNVEKGGIGAGTVIHFQMQLMGRLQMFHAEITEPEPGRVLVETDRTSGAVTTFTVEPQDSGERSQVTITTDTKVRDGILGVIEGWLTTQLLRPIYVKELEQLARVVAG